LPILRLERLAGLAGLAALAATAIDPAVRPRGALKKRHQPHQPLIGLEMPADVVAEKPLTGINFLGGLTALTEYLSYAIRPI